jgi:GNAT superfamily N-acetyltransferase
MTSVTVTNEPACNVNESRVPKTQIKLCTLDDIKGKTDSLFEEHYEEVARNKEIMVLKPNWPMYYATEKVGALFIHVATQDDEFIGYSINFVSNHFHYADLKYCQNDVLFIKKEFRGGRVGLRLMKATETHAKSLGCKLMLWHCKEKTPLNEILPRLKYGVQDIIYSKEL